MDGHAQTVYTFNTSGTFVVPAGVGQVTVECWGGGGRGGSMTVNNRGGGGGGGAYARSTLSVVPGTPFTVTVGSGSTSASPGGDSWFGSTSTVLAKGGNSVPANTSTGAAGGSSAACVGTTVFSGGNGGNAVTSSSGAGGGSSAGTAANGTNGGTSLGGTAPAGGGNGGDGGTGGCGPGLPGATPGGGGGGGRRQGGCSVAEGGAGGNGVVVVTVISCIAGTPCDDGDDNTTGDVLDASCNCAGVNTPWYSQGSGTFTDPIWSHDPGGPGATATLNSGSVVVVQPTHVVTVAAAQDISSLLVQPGADVSIASGVSLSVHGVGVTVDGGLVASDNGVLSLVGTSAQALDGTGLFYLFDLQVTSPAGTTVGAVVDVRGTLQLDAGVFTVGTGTVTLVSGAPETGRLGPVAPGASYVGDLGVQRFVPAGVTNWRLLSSSVTGATLQQWNDDFLTAGFPGSDFPGFDNPVGSGILWPSIRVYDETNAGPGLNDGLAGVANITNPIQQGGGYAAWCGDALNTTSAFTIDIAGPPVIANSPVALPMSYTNTGVPATDGWNLVGNPLPSPIDFGALSLGADVENEFWVFDPVAGNNVFWNETLGTGSSVMNGNIQSSQGFWLHATGPGVTTTVDEGAKTFDPNGGAPFGGMLLQNEPMLRLGLHSQMNQFRDETLLHFGAGQPDNDGPDMEKFFFSHPEAPQLWSAGADGVDLALNAWGEITAPVTIPVKVQTWVAGSYTLEVMQHTQPMDDLCVVLEDVVTGVSTPLGTGVSYSFTLASGVPADPARFLLHVAPAPQGALTSSAQQVLVGEPVQFSSGTQPGTPVTWEFGDGSTSTDPDPVHAYGMPGNYPVQLTIGQAPCDLVLTEVIEVSVSTGLPALDDEAFRAWMDGSAIRLRWDLGGSDVHEVKVFDPRGREVRALRLAEASGQATIDMADQPHGVFVLRLQSDRLLRTVKLPVVR